MSRPQEVFIHHRRRADADSLVDALAVLGRDCVWRLNFARQSLLSAGLVFVDTPGTDDTPDPVLRWRELLGEIRAALRPAADVLDDITGAPPDTDVAVSRMASRSLVVVAMFLRTTAQTIDDAADDMVEADRLSSSGLDDIETNTAPAYDMSSSLLRYVEDGTWRVLVEQYRHDLTLESDNVLHLRPPEPVTLDVGPIYQLSIKGMGFCARADGAPPAAAAAYQLLPHLLSESAYKGAFDDPPTLPGIAAQHSDPWTGSARFALDVGAPRFTDIAELVVTEQRHRHHAFLRLAAQLRECGAVVVFDGLSDRARAQPPLPTRAAEHHLRQVWSTVLGEGVSVRHDPSSDALIVVSSSAMPAEGHRSFVSELDELTCLETSEADGRLDAALRVARCSSASRVPNADRLLYRSLFNPALATDDVSAAGRRQGSQVSVARCQTAAVRAWAPRLTAIVNGMESTSARHSDGRLLLEWWFLGRLWEMVPEPDVQDGRPWEVDRLLVSRHYGTPVVEEHDADALRASDVDRDAGHRRSGGHHGQTLRLWPGARPFVGRLRTLTVGPAIETDVAVGPLTR